MLDELDADNVATLQESIQAMDYPAGSSDGWRKKSCMSGAGLMNFTVMGNSGAWLPPQMAYAQPLRFADPCLLKLLYVAPLQAVHLAHVETVSGLHAGALLFDVINCSDMRKDKNRLIY
jgi:hypothetical protein